MLVLGGNYISAVWIYPSRGLLTFNFSSVLFYPVNLGKDLENINRSPKKRKLIKDSYIGCSD